MAGTLTISGMAAGLPFGEEIIGPLSMMGGTVVGQVDDASLAVGDNSFSVPVGSLAVLIVLGSAGVPSAVTVRTNANATDTGLPVAPFSNVGFVVVPVPSGVTTVILNASAVVAGVSLVFI